MITYGELVSQKFVAPEEQERLRRYLEAKRRFFGFFGSNGREPDALALETLGQAERAVHVLQEQLVQRVAFIREQVVPSVKELLQHEPDKIELIERRIAQLAELVHDRWDDAPLRALRGRCEAALDCSHSIRALLLELREQFSEAN